MAIKAMDIPAVKPRPVLASRKPDIDLFGQPAGTHKHGDNQHGKRKQHGLVKPEQDPRPRHEEVRQKAAAAMAYSPEQQQLPVTGGGQPAGHVRYSG